jgi:class 3 adenylate cyclase
MSTGNNTNGADETRTSMFIDIENYTEILQMLGDTEVARSSAGAEQFQTPCHNIISNVIKPYPDAEIEMTVNGFIVRFAKPTDAVQSAIGVQKGLVKENFITPLEENPPLRFCIGIDTETDSRASEVKSTACGGEVLISERIYDLLKAKYDSFNDELSELSDLLFYPREDLSLKGFEREKLIQVLWGAEKKIATKNVELLEDSDRQVGSEAIVVIDIVESTGIGARVGWTIVKELLQVLKRHIVAIGQRYGIQCRKSTGDGFLLSYTDQTNQALEHAVINAVEASFNLLSQLGKYNSNQPEEKQVHVRIAIHFGEVDIVEGDREGLAIAYTFRLENIDRETVRNNNASRHIEPDEFPEQNYVICSEVVSEAIEKRCPNFRSREVGLFKLKGFANYHEVYLVEEANDSQP